LTKRPHRRSTWTAR